MAEPLADFLSRPLPKVQHIIGRGILPTASLAVVGGQAKHNKSYVVLNMMLNLARGENIFNAVYPSGVPVMPVTKPYRVLYIEQEIGHEGLQERLLQMTEGEIPQGLDLYIKSRDMQMRLDSSEGVYAIGQELEQVKPDVLILDPLREFVLIDENSSQEMSAVIRVLKSWIEKYECSIVLVHHVGKLNEEHPRRGGDKLRGSSALFGAVDTYIGVERNSEASNPTPLLTLEFEIRRGKPILPMEVRKMESGVIHYVKDKFGGHVSRPVTLPKPARDFEWAEPERKP